MKDTNHFYNNSTIEKIFSLPRIINNNRTILATKKVTAGFDGFIDTIVKIIREKQELKMPVFFTTIREFGNYILGKEGASFSLELEELNIKLGGNLPIMSNALGKLGVAVNCLGAFGYPKLHNVFKDLSPNCRIYSFADPGTSTALEFNDGKIMFAQMGILNTHGWDKIKQILGIETIIHLFNECDLFCVVNWSEIDASSDIWKGLLTDVLPGYPLLPEKKISFFDLSDCSKRDDESIIEVFSLLKEFAKYTKVILSLNQNEARRIHEVLYHSTSNNDFGYLGEEIYEQLRPEILLLHHSKEAFAFTSDGKVSCKTFFIDHPKISTGAGDNFNAGFAAAQLLGLDLESSVIFANALSGLYVKTGASPELNDVLNFLEEIKKELK